MLKKKKEKETELVHTKPKNGNDSWYDYVPLKSLQVFRNLVYKVLFLNYKKKIESSNIRTVIIFLKKYI